MLTSFKYIHLKVEKTKRNSAVHIYDANNLNIRFYTKEKPIIAIVIISAQSRLNCTYSTSTFYVILIKVHSSGLFELSQLNSSSLFNRKHGLRLKCDEITMRLTFQ